LLLLGALGNFGGIFMPWLVGVVADYWGLASATLCPSPHDFDIATNARKP
jgi:hypothetical protein